MIYWTNHILRYPAQNHHFIVLWSIDHWQYLSRTNNWSTAHCIGIPEVGHARQFCPFPKMCGIDRNKTTNSYNTPSWHCCNTQQTRIDLLVLSVSFLHISWEYCFNLQRTLQWPHNERVGSQITGVSIVCSTVCSGEDQRKQQSSTSLVFVRESTGNRWIPLTKGQ